MLQRKSNLTGSSSPDALAECVRQLDTYFAGQLKAFDLPLSFKATDFQARVLRALQQIPYGTNRHLRRNSEPGRKPESCACGGLG